MRTLNQVRITVARVLNIVASTGYHIREDIPSIEVALFLQSIHTDVIETLAEISGMASIVIGNIPVLRSDLLEEKDNLFVDQGKLVKDLFFCQDVTDKSSHFLPVSRISQSENVKSPMLDRL